MELATTAMEQELTEKPNQCLGKDSRTDQRCATMLPKGMHLCPDCQRRINSAGRNASKVSSGNGHQYGNKLNGVAE